MESHELGICLTSCCFHNKNYVMTLQISFNSYTSELSLSGRSNSKRTSRKKGLLNTEIAIVPTHACTSNEATTIAVSRPLVFLLLFIIGKLFQLYTCACFASTPSSTALSSADEFTCNKSSYCFCRVLALVELFSFAVVVSMYLYVGRLTSLRVFCDTSLTGHLQQKPYAR